MLINRAINLSEPGYDIRPVIPDSMVRRYTDRIISLLDQKAEIERRTYGFEYELLPTRPLDLDDMEMLYRFFSQSGFDKSGTSFIYSNGLSVAFEPGGQIEYQSPPLFDDDYNTFNRILNSMERINRNIYNELDIKYKGTDYFPGRDKAPLCLTSKRYRDMHERMLTCGTRGREMMKGTASIHLHVSINSSEEVAQYFPLLLRLASDKDFRMGEKRRDIWDKTDPSRCGMPYNKSAAAGPEPVIGDIVRFALLADDISNSMPFYLKEDISFEIFLYHMTTLFTDIRLNMKGPTLELRTLDSMPFDQFRPKWVKFISALNPHYQDKWREEMK